MKQPVMLYISRTLIAMLLLLLPFLQTTSGYGAAEGGDTRGFTDTETSILNSVNRIRAQYRLRPLRASASLSDFARLHSRDMAENGFLDHNGNDGRSFKSRVISSGISGWRVIGENIGRSFGHPDNAEAIVSGWMKSRPHRKNILSGRFDTTGIGTALADDGTLYATQVFTGAPEQSPENTYR